MSLPNIRYLSAPALFTTVGVHNLCQIEGTHGQVHVLTVHDFHHVLEQYMASDHPIYRRLLHTARRKLTTFTKLLNAFREYQQPEDTTWSGTWTSNFALLGSWDTHWSDIATLTPIGQFTFQYGTSEEFCSGAVYSIPQLILEVAADPVKNGRCIGNVELSARLLGSIINTALSLQIAPTHTVFLQRIGNSIGVLSEYEHIKKMLGSPPNMILWG